jgi:phosphoribulokinase
VQVLPTNLIPDDDEAKVLRVKMIQKEGSKLFDPVHLFDEGSSISWIPCGRKLSCSFPGIKFNYGPDDWCALIVSPLLCICSLLHVLLHSWQAYNYSHDDWCAPAPSAC